MDEPMIFNNEKAIYVQIADRLREEILAGKYKPATSGCPACGNTPSCWR